MPSIEIIKATDVDQFRLAIRPRSSNFMVTGRGAFAAEVKRVDLDQIWTQRADESLARIWYLDGVSDRTTISFLAEPGPAISWRGVEIGSDDILPFGPGLCGWHKLSGMTRWGSMSLPNAELSVAVTGRDLTPSRDTISMTPPLAALARLRRLHAAAGRIAETAPEIIENPEAARGLEQALVAAMFGCLETGDAHEDTGARRHHSTILRRFQEAAEAHADAAVFLPEICAAIGVKERTLRICCNEGIGISPGKYLLLRRLHLAQQSLSTADPAASNVTEIATRYGFWELGRFATYYKGLFGESPSNTLRRPPM